MLTILSDGFKSSSARTLAKEAVLSGRRAILLVPEQETLNAELEMALALPSSYPLFLEVTNFSRLANTVFRMLGGICYRYADSAAEALLMWKTLNSLTPLLHVARTDAGAVEEMLSALSELYASGIDEAALSAAARKLADNTALKEKLEDLSLIFHTYRGERAEIYGSHAEDLDRLALLLKENAPFKDTLFFVDSFSSFTEQEYRILGALMRQADVSVALTLKEGEHPSLCYEETKSTKARLLDLASLTTTEVQCKDGEDAPLPPALLHAKEQLFRADKAVVPFGKETDAISLWHAKTPFEAADAIAADIAARVREGAHYSDCVVFVRDMKKYSGIIDAALERQGVPFFSSETREVHSFSLVRMIRAAYAVLTKGYRSADVMAFLKCGFGEVDANDIDVFEIYTDFWHINGKSFLSDEPWTMNPDGYASRLTERGKETLTRANAVKKALCDMLAPLKDGAHDGDDLKTHATALYNFLKHLAAEKRLHEMAKKEEARGHKAEANALLMLFGVVLDMLDTACEAAGDMNLTREQFSDLLGVMFSSMSFGQLPTSPDTVTVGSAELLRAKNARFAYLLGVNEGEFPATVTAGGAFADSERKILEELGLTLSFDPLVRASHEQFCFLRALTAPSECAALFAYEKDAAGGAVPPSTVFGRLEKLFSSASSIKKIEAYTPSAALALSLSPPEREALSTLLEGKAEFEHFLKSKDVPIFKENCSIDNELAGELFTKTVRMSQSRFNSYRLCPFSYYCKHVLGLSEGGHAEFNALSIGSFIHKILEKILPALKKDNKDPKTVDPAEIPKYVEVLCREYVEEVCPKELLSSPRLRHFLSRLERSAVIIVEDLLEEFKQSAFFPVFFEFSIGKGDGPEPLAFELDDDALMLFRGEIDRVDVFCHPDGQLYLRVVDYKKSKKTFSVGDVKKGKNLQMLLYLFTLCESKNPELKKLLKSKIAECTGEEPKDGESDLGVNLMPAGVSYMTTSVADVNLDAPCDVDKLKSEAKKKLTRSGLTLDDATVASAIDQVGDGHYLPAGSATLDEMKAIFDEMKVAVKALGSDMRTGNASAAPSPEAVGRGMVCDYCAFKPVCKIH